MITYTPDNREIYYCTTGTGRELLLVHGAGGDAEAFNALVEILSPQYCCISFDRLGYRRSAHLDRNTTVEEQVTAIGAVNNCVTLEPVWVFGHSSGGNFALAYALSYPDRVKGLILMEPALYSLYPPHQQPPEIERMEKDIVPLFQQGQIEQGLEEFMALIGISQQSVDQLPPTRNAFDNFRSFGYDQPVVISWCPSEAELHQVTQPVLIMEGDQSSSLLRNICHLLGRQLSNSKLITLKDQGHLAPQLAPKLVAEELTAFISQCESKT